MEEIELVVDGLKLKGNLYYPEVKKDKHPAILFIHGWTGEKKRNFQYAQMLKELGYIVMLFDMRGHGISEGDIKTFTPKEFFKDCLAAYDYLASLPKVDPDNISVVGSSFGGYLNALLTAERKVANAVLRVPADYINEAFENLQINNGGGNPGVNEWRMLSRKPDETYALKAISKFTGEILIIESEKDTVVPHQTVQNYVNAVIDKRKHTHIVMKDAPHSIKEGPFMDEVTRILKEWFNKIRG